MTSVLTSCICGAILTAEQESAHLWCDACEDALVELLREQVPRPGPRNPFDAHVELVWDSTEHAQWLIDSL